MAEGNLTLETFARLRNEILAAIKGAISDQGTAVGTQTAAIEAQTTAVVAAIAAQTAAFQAAFPRVTGTFTMAAAATTTVLDTHVTSTSLILLMPTNASAGTLVGSVKSPYISARNAGVSFVVATASAGAAAGTETFTYSVF